MTHIRTATPLDSETIREINLLAFPESERLIVSTLAVNLLLSKSDPQTLSFITEVEGLPVGHIAFSPATSPGSRYWQGYTLAPLAVRPEYQRRGIGSRLVQHGIQLLFQMGVDTLLVYGDPDYYGRFGIDASSALAFVPPFPLQYPHGWLALSLRPKPDPAQPMPIRCVEPFTDPRLW